MILTEKCEHCGAEEKTNWKCKPCVAKHKRQHYLDNIEEILKDRKIYNAEHKEQRKQYLEDNEEYISERQKKYDTEHKEEKAIYNKKYNEEHKEEKNIKAKIYNDSHKEDRQQYYKDNKEKTAQNKKEYRKKRKENNPSFKFRILMSTSISRTLVNNGGSKQGESCMDRLPYSIDELKQYIESLFEPWMSWNNHGKYNSKTWDDNNQLTWTWHLDHIVPHSHFKYTSMEDEAFKQCWALSNLRPYSAKQNLLDGNRR